MIVLASAFAGPAAMAQPAAQPPATAQASVPAFQAACADCHSTYRAEDAPTGH